MKELHRIILSPKMTEKSEKLKEKVNQYCFEVGLEANKIEIRQAVEQLFDLKNKVLNVQTLRTEGKLKRRGRGRNVKYIRRAERKKAIVTLVPGAVISVFDQG
ncbi:MAG: 50S ribosomal protein L23 [Deltaproteobacteria bacterium]|jgi:large subunit ribosomal protein L23|nr:50S ribosomal protein L23 [Deltaproteobacteria bacterium]